MDAAQPSKLDAIRLAVARLCECVGLPVRRLAGWLGVPESTVRSWCDFASKLLQGDRLMRPGRPRKVPSKTQARDIRMVLHAHAGKVGVRELKRSFPGVGRAALAWEKSRYQRVLAKRGRRGLAILRWPRPGAIWAMDHCEIPGGVEGASRHVLVVKDLASGLLLASRSCRDQRAETTCVILDRLMQVYGAPLVLKSDNGPGFIAGPTRALLGSRGALPLYSPPGVPAYNGAAEAGVHAIKGGAQQLADLRGRGAQVRVEDLEAARDRENSRSVRGAPSSDERWRGREELCPVLREELGLRRQRWEERLRREQGIAQAEVLGHAAQAALDRFAIGEALREMSLLKIERR